jgi:hypothetical protein
MEVARRAVAILVGVLAGCGGAAASAPSGLQAPPPPRPTVTVTLQASSPPPPTWTAIFATYFGPGSPGGCGQASRCHAEQMRDASSAYDWLARRGYIDGTRSALVSPSNSCLRWFGGNMPPQARPADGDATRDLQAWVAAGALDD